MPATGPAKTEGEKSLEYREDAPRKRERKKKRRRRGCALNLAAVILLIGAAAYLLIQRGGWLRGKVIHSASGALPSGQEEEKESGPWNLILVNRWNPIPDGYTVELITLSNGEAVDERIYPALQEMFDQMRADGVYPVVASGYRTGEEQQSIVDERIAQYQAEGYSLQEAKAQTDLWVAAPGTSEHELGLAVDINADGIHSAGYEVYDWLDQNGARYGFIQRYPADKTEITGVSNEPWHYRYVGKEAAAAIQDSGLCLEEYVALLD